MISILIIGIIGVPKNEDNTALKSGRSGIIRQIFHAIV